MAVQALHGLSSRCHLLEAHQGIRLTRKHFDAVERAKLAKNCFQSALIWAGGGVAQQQMPAGLRRCSKTTQDAVSARRAFAAATQEAVSARRAFAAATQDAVSARRAFIAATQAAVSARRAVVASTSK